MAISGQCEEQIIHASIINMITYAGLSWSCIDGTGRQTVHLTLNPFRPTFFMIWNNNDNAMQILFYSNAHDIFYAHGRHLGLLSYTSWKRPLTP